MQLKIQRSQRAGGITGGTVYFCLDVRADYTPEERENISKYRLGSEVIYNSQAARKHLETAGTHLDRTQVGGVGERAAGLARGAFSLAMAKMSLNISIASLGRGHHIECKDLAELLEAEEIVRNACKSVTQFLETAATFNGSEVVIEYDKGEERVHITQSAPPLLSYDASDSSANPGGQIIDQPGAVDPTQELGRKFGKFWSDPTNRKIVTAGLAIVLVIFLLHSCFR
jgi:hypothetical protein